MAANPILAESVRAAKTRPMFYAFLAKGADGTLLLSKSKVPTKDVEEAKKQQGGGMAFRGVCHWIDSQLVFEIGHQPPTSLAGQIKKAIKRDTDMMMDVVTRFSKDLEGEDDGVEVPSTDQLKQPKSEEQSKKEEQTRDSQRLEEEVRTLFLELSGRSKSALSGPNGTKVKEQFGNTMMGLLQKSQRQINSKDFEHTSQTLKDLKDLLDKIPGTKAPSQSGTELLAGLNELSGPIKELMKGPKKQRVTELIKNFDKFIKNNEFDFAGMALRELEGYVKQPPSGGKTTAEWKNEIEPNLKNYKVGKSVGKGTFGTASIIETGEPGSPPLVAKFPNQPQYLRFLEDEEKIYQQVGDHPNIPKCMGIVEVDGKKALVLEAVEGETAGKTMSNMRARYKSGELSHEEYWGAMQQMTSKMLLALAHLEEKGLVHKDIKPDNLMIDKNGELKVIDLGGAKQKGEDKGYSGYTPGYDAPETKNVGGAFDVFSTGIVVRGDINAPGRNNESENVYADFIKWVTNPDPKLRPTAKEALAHPFLAGSLLDEEKAKEVLAGQTKEAGVALPVTKGFNQAAWDQTMAEAVKLKKVQGSSGATISKVSDLLRQLGDPAVQFKSFPRQTAWPAKSKAMERAKELADALLDAIKQLKATATSDLSTYLYGQMQSPAEQIKREIGPLMELGGPELTEAKFADKWREIKKEAENEFQTAVQALKDQFGSRYGKAENNLKDKFNELREKDASERELAKFDYENPKVLEQEVNRLLTERGLGKATTAEKLFDFSDNFSGALDDFEKAASRQDKSFADKKAKALKIAQKYFRGVVQKAKTFDGAPDEFVTRLQWRINDLVHSIDEKKIAEPVGKK